MIELQTKLQRRVLAHKWAASWRERLGERKKLSVGEVDALRRFMDYVHVILEEVGPGGTSGSGGSINSGGSIISGTANSGGGGRSWQADMSYEEFRQRVTAAQEPRDG